MTSIEKKIMRGLSKRGCVYEKDIIQALCKSESITSYGEVLLAIRKLEINKQLSIRTVHGTNIITSMCVRH